MKFLEQGVWAAVDARENTQNINSTMGYIQSPSRHKLHCEQVLKVVSNYFGLGLVDLLSRSRNKQKIAFARQIAMYLANTHYAVPMSEIGKVFGRDRTTVSFGCRKIEDCRDSQRVDTIICCLELMLSNVDTQPNITPLPNGLSHKMAPAMESAHG